MTLHQATTASIHHTDLPAPSITNKISTAKRIQWLYKKATTAKIPKRLKLLLTQAWLISFAC